MFEAKTNIRYIIERNNECWNRKPFYCYLYLDKGEVVACLSPFGAGRFFDKYDLKQMMKAIELGEKQKVKI